MRKAPSPSGLLKQVKLPFALAAATLLVGSASSSWAASIGGSFIGRGAANDVLAPNDSAGVVAQTHWNNIPDDGTTFSGTTVSLRDDSDNFTNVKIVYTASDSWNSDGPEGTPDQKLMKGIIKANPTPDTAPTNNTDRMVFVITNLPAAGVYNVIVYMEENGAWDIVGGGANTNGAEAIVTVGATTYYIEQEGKFGDTFFQASSTSPLSYLVANYAEFDNVAAVGGTITITARKNIVNPQINDGIGVSAIQLIQVAGPAFPANTDTSSITTQPASTAVADGTIARFTVGVGGPAKVQWQKNGTDIAGATAATLAYPATLADNNAQFTAVVYNNVNTNTSTAATLLVVAPVLTQGFSSVQRWEGIGGNTGPQGIQDLTNAIGAGPATITFYSPGINVPQTSPNLVNFGAKVWGWVQPDVTGDYNFFIRSDDSSQLFLNPVAAASGTNALPNIFTDAPIAREDTCCNGFTEPPSPRTTAAPIHLEGGKLYGFVALYKEGGGGDYVQVAWRATTDTTGASALKPIAPRNTWTMAAPVGQAASITTQPASITVIQGRPAIFPLAVTTTPNAGAYWLEWLVNGTVVPNATTIPYIIPSVALGDNNKTIQARVHALTGILNSTIATLTVIPDTNAPVVTGAGGMTRVDGVVQIGVTFDEPIDSTTVIPANFTITGGTVTGTKIATNSLQTYSSVVLDTTGLTAGNTYNVNVKNVKDVYGNAMSPVNMGAAVGKVSWAETGVPIAPGQVIPIGATGFDILNGGRQEWNSYDEATIAYVKKTNDFDVKVQVIYAEPGSQWTRVGLMARNWLNAGEPSSDGTGGGTNASAYAQTHVNPSQTLGSSGIWPGSDPVQPVNNTPNNGHEQNQRLASAAATTGWGNAGAGGAPTYPNSWLRLQRSGTTLHGYSSTNGVTWVDQGTTTLTTQQPDMYVGPFLAVETGNIWPGGGFNVWTSPYNPTYDRLFLAQFRNFSDTADVVTPTISIGRTGGILTITFTGVLYSSSTVNGTYTPVSGATSPYTVPTGPAAGFYRSGP